MYLIPDVYAPSLYLPQLREILLNPHFNPANGPSPWKKAT